MTVPTTLLLFPTQLERELVGASGLMRRDDVRHEICGFGPIAAAARTAQLLGRARPHRAILVGLAGTYDPRRLPVGQATTFDEVVLDGVGAGQGERFESASALGFAQWPGSDEAGDRPIQERLPLVPAPRRHEGARVLVTVCAASATSAEAAARRDTHAALAEDMEAFAVALACTLHRVPISVVRGISNVAGDRHKSHWQIEPALREAGQLLLEALDGNRVTGDTP